MSEENKEMNDEQKRLLEDLFQEFMASPESVYPWSIYEKWNEYRNGAKEFSKETWKDLIYANDICSSKGDAANKPEGEIDDTLKTSLTNLVEEKVLSENIKDELNKLFNTSKKNNSKERNFETRVNRLAAIFDDKSSFIPSLDKFKECLKYLKATCGININVKNQEWVKLNEALYNQLENQLKCQLSELDKNQQGDPKQNKVFILKAFPTWIQFTKDRLFPTDSNPNVIYYGAPGTGKTYIVKSYLKTLFPDEKSYKEHVRWVQFHPSFSYEDFIEGIKPVGIDKITKSVNLKLVNGVFKKHCIDAKKKPEEKFYFVADEINRANISAVFGETLSLLEASYRDDGSGENLIETQYSELEKQLDKEEQKEICYDIAKPENDEQSQGNSESNSNENDSHPSTALGDNPEKMSETSGKFGIPKNIYFIGMMNDVDKSIDAFDLALRRRFKWIRMDCDYSVIKKFVLNEIKDEKNVNEFIRKCAKLNYFISGRDPEQYKGLGETVKKGDISRSLKMGSSYEFGHSNFLKIIDICHQDKIEKRHLDELFTQFLQPTLKEYLRSSCSEDKIDDELENAKEIFTTGKEKKDEQKK